MILRNHAEHDVTEPAVTTEKGNTMKKTMKMGLAALGIAVMLSGVTTAPAMAAVPTVQTSASTINIKPMATCRSETRIHHEWIQCWSFFGHAIPSNCYYRVTTCR